MKDNSDEIHRQVTQFLSGFQRLLDHKNCPIKSYKNDKTLIKLGFTENDVIPELYGLVEEDYSSGPHPDEYSPGSFWVFGKMIEGILIYIKIKIATDDNGEDWPVCFSFHEAEYNMKFPLK